MNIQEIKPLKCDYDHDTCFEMFKCCDCGITPESGMNGCACGGCWSCNACEYCYEKAIEDDV